jgi:CBS domain-containing protein
MRVRDVMTSPVVTVGPDDRPKDVAALLVSRAISGVPVLDDSGQLVGIVSEADLVLLETGEDPRAHVILSSTPPSPAPTRVEQIMTRDVVSLPPDADVAEAARVMLERHIKRVLIVDEGRVVGIVSRRDLLRILARSDLEIANELDALLSDEILSLGHLRTEVHDGVVDLYGGDDPATLRLGELVARSVPGVLEVRIHPDRR